MYILCLAVVKPNATVPALLAKPVLGRGVRTREAVLLLLADLLHQRLPSAGSEFAQACAKKEQLATLLRLLDDPASPTALAVLALLQQL